MAMTQYFYADGDDRKGPVTLDQLRAAPITRGTLVWYEGMPDWKPAGQLPELSDLFLVQGASEPPPTPQATTLTPPASSVPPAAPVGSTVPAAAPRRNTYDELGGPPPKTYLLESILVTVLCCLPLGIVGIVNASKVESRYYAGDVEQAHYYSREAKKWTKYGAIGGAVFVVLYIGIILVGAIGGSL